MNRGRICGLCVLPETPAMPLDSSGICRLCKTPELLAHIYRKPDPAALSEIINRVKKRGSGTKYDCVVAWSGGRDSTFMLNELVAVHGLRCLAVFGRTPFTPERIIENVRSIAGKLNVKLVEIESPKNHLDVARFCLNEWTVYRQPILINLACAPCKMINREIFRIAASNKIKTVIYGGNRLEYFPHGPASVDINRDDRYSFGSMVVDNVFRIAKGLKILAGVPVLMKHIVTLFRASVLYINQYSLYLRLRYPGIERFDYYHFADWDEDRVETALSELGWRLPDGCVSSWRADCLFEAVKNSAFEQQLGYTYHHALLGNMIRAGKMTRAQALERLSSLPPNERRLNEALALLDIRREDFVRNLGPENP